jgi:NADH-quinone oxidoreductase subunit M
VAMWLMLGFFAAFAVKLPVVPFHTWLPDAHTEAPTAGSVILAGLLLKTGAYGLLRFTVPLFPDAAQAFAPVAMGLGVIGILYGGVLAFAQTDLKRLVAYSSVSHLGFVLLGIFAWNALALEGAVMQMLAHGVTTGALFILVGALQERLHTRDMRRMGGLWTTLPRFGAFGLFFAIASLGLPGLGNFVGEFLVLLGTYRVSIPMTALASLGLVVATIYSLALVQQPFHGQAREQWNVQDLSSRSLAVLGILIAVQVWLGLYPVPVLETAGQALHNLYGIGDVPTITSRR